MFLASPQIDPAATIWSGTELRARLDRVARWALAALPGVDGVLLAVHRPSALTTGTAGLADDIDPSSPYYQIGTRVERSLPLLAGDQCLGALTLYVCELPGQEPTALPPDVDWLAGPVAATAATMVAQALLPPVPDGAAVAARVPVAAHAMEP